MTLLLRVTLVVPTRFTVDLDAEELLVTVDLDASLAIAFARVPVTLVPLEV